MTELFVFMFKGYGRRHSVATALCVGFCGATEERIMIASFEHVDNRIDEALPVLRTRARFLRLPPSQI